MTVDVQIDVWCSCGEGLCGGTSVTPRGLIVEPCPRCLEREYDAGFNSAGGG